MKKSTFVILIAALVLTLASSCIVVDDMRNPKSLAKTHIESV